MTIRLTVDGRDVEMSSGAGASVLDAINHAGVYLPQLCKDPDQAPLGTCRTCLVEIEGLPGTPAACSIPARDGMVVHTAGRTLDRIRKGVLQLTIDMLPTSDLDHLGELGRACTYYGLQPGPLAARSQSPARDRQDESNPFWLLDHSRCILCQRCVAACQDVQHIYAIGLLGRGDSASIGTFARRPIADSICTSCGQCWAACPTEAIRLKRPLAIRESDPLAGSIEQNGALPTIARRVETVCPYCGVGCGLTLCLGEHDELIQVEDAPANESSRGMLCVKGRYGTGFINSPERLTTPMIRRVRGGPLAPATWDEALELVAREFARHRGRLGVIGSAKATNEDSYVLQKFARLIMGTNNVDHCARLCHSPSVVALIDQLGSGSTSNSYLDYERAGCLLVAGSDPDTNHPVISARLRKGVIENGAALIVVNPRRIRLCDIADLWLRPRPGTDVALFNGLAAIALEEGLWDQSFVEHRTEGFAAWRAALSPYTAASASTVTGIPEAELRQAARLFARPVRGNSCLIWGMGITQHTGGTANVRSMINLALLTGQIGKPGSGLSPLRGQNNVQGCGDSGLLPNFLPGYHTLTPEALEKFGRAWGGELPSQPGLALTEMFDAILRDELTALYVAGENPLLSEPNISHVEQAMHRVPFIVVQTVFPNEMTALADVVLPAATFAEKDGTFTNSERRVQRVRRAIPAPGSARADWEITCDIARRASGLLGQATQQFDYDHPSDIFDELALLVPPFAGINYERLDRGGIQWPCPATDHPGSPMLFMEAFPRGRARFVPVDQGLPAAELPDRKYPLLLNTGRVLYHWHGGDLSRQVPGLVELYPVVEVSINPADATAIGLADGDQVRVRSRRGALIGTARVTDAMRRGEIFIPFVRLREAAANFLTNDVYDPQAKIPEYKVCAVRLEPVPVGSD